MPIPDYQTIMLPFLRIAEDGKQHSKREALDKLAADFKLTESELRELLPSGKQELFDNRVGWARTYLKKAGLIDSPGRGYFRITERGLDLLKQNPAKIDGKILRQYPEYREFVNYNNSRVNRDVSEDKSTKENEETTPQERLYNAYEQINEELARDILQQLKTVSPKSFEHIVVDLLVAMGYGGSDKDAAQAIGRSGDEGGDGVINQDTLGIDRIYIQAKRWNDTLVNHSEIRNFIGALDFKHAERGIFITTSAFTKAVRESVALSSKRIILIDGNELARLMITHKVGVSVEDEFELKKLDMDYFIEE
jgi:restriction system protein